MGRGGFLSEEDRRALLALARDGSAVSLVTRHANALVLLDGGMRCREVAKVLFFDDDTIRGWRQLFEQNGCRVRDAGSSCISCPHLNPIERLWGVMLKPVTHNKSYVTCAPFVDATLDFLRDQVPRRWAEFRDSVTDNFRIISPKDFRLLGGTGYRKTDLSGDDGLEITHPSQRQKFHPMGAAQGRCGPNMSVAARQPVAPAAASRARSACRLAARIIRNVPENPPGSRHSPRISVPSALTTPR